MSGHDDGVGESDESVDDEGTSFGAGDEFLEAAVVPEIGSLDDPPLADLGREALLADHAAAAEFVEQVAGLAVVVVGIEMDRGVLG